MSLGENPPPEADREPAKSREQPGRPPSKALWWLGLTLGVAVHLLLLAPPPLMKVIQVSGHREAQFHAAGLWFLLGMFTAVPATGIALSLIRCTRRFGVGFLLGCGLSWLTLGSLCVGRSLFK